MATQETKVLDNIIASRRALLVGGSAALAAMAMPKSAHAAATVTAYKDTDILNFALNLEYLEANFYYMAAFGTTIDKPNSASIAAGGPSAGIGIGAGSTTTGTTATIGIATKVPFAIPAVQAYAIETAIEEGKHVSFLRTALGSAAVAQPAIDISPVSFTAAANAASIPGTFNPYLNDAFFLVGAYIFEDVGVTAYLGAAPLITDKTTILPAAVGILGVEAYHAGLIRSTIQNVDPVNAAGYLTLTDQISALRASLSLKAAPATPGPYDTNPDDYGLLTPTGGQPMGPTGLAGGSAVTRTQVADCDNTNFIAFSRTTTQVLNIVTGGGGAVSGTPAKGVFFPSGLNGLFV